MEWARKSFLVGVLICLGSPALAQERPGELLSRSLLQPRLKDTDVLQRPAVQMQPPAGKPGGKDKDKPPPPKFEEEAALPPTPTEAPAGPNPHMISEFPGTYALMPVTVPAAGQVIITIPAVRPPQPPIAPPPPQQRIITFNTTVQRFVRVPIASRGNFKIAENESPAPQDRVFFTYNYFNAARGPNDGSNIPITTSQTSFVNGLPVTTIVSAPGVSPPRFDVHRETFGFEKTFFDNASIGLRVPFFQQQGDGSFSDQDIGDLTLILKYAPWWDRQTNNVLSVGMAITVPTGPDIQTVSGPIHPTLLQPYLGYMLSGDRLFLQGFSSIVVPTDSRDVTLLFNDVGVGFRLFQDDSGDRLFRFVVPTLEAHVTTPLDHRSQSDPIIGTDLVVLLGGVHLGVGSRSTLTFGVATPVTGPRLFSVEGIAQFNLRF